MTVYTHTYQDVTAFLSDATKPPLPGNPNESRTGGLKFTGTRNFGDALNLIQNGWKEGREKLITALAAAANLHMQVKSHVLDVAGAFPVIPLACAGDPACMMDIFEEDTKTKPIVRLGVQIAASSSYTPNEIMTYGAAVLSYVNALELAGYRVELWTLSYCSNVWDGNGCSIEVRIKAPDEPMSLDRVAFCLGHPSMNRRFKFAVYEALRPKLNSLYGSPAELPAREDMLTVAGINTFSQRDLLRNGNVAGVVKVLEPIIAAQWSKLGAESPKIDWSVIHS